MAVAHRRAVTGTRRCWLAAAAAAAASSNVMVIMMMMMTVRRRRSLLDGRRRRRRRVHQHHVAVDIRLPSCNKPTSTSASKTFKRQLTSSDNTVHSANTTPSSDSIRRLRPGSQHVDGGT